MNVLRSTPAETTGSNAQSCTLQCKDRQAAAQSGESGGDLAAPRLDRRSDNAAYRPQGNHHQRWRAPRSQQHEPDECERKIAW
jgi:hypothetical protein